MCCIFWYTKELKQEKQQLNTALFSLNNFYSQFVNATMKYIKCKYILHKIRYRSLKMGFILRFRY